MWLNSAQSRQRFRLLLTAFHVHVSAQIIDRLDLSLHLPFHFILARLPREFDALRPGRVDSMTRLVLNNVVARLRILYGGFQTLELFITFVHMTSLLRLLVGLLVRAEEGNSIGRGHLCSQSFISMLL